MRIPFGGPAFLPQVRIRRPALGQCGGSQESPFPIQANGGRIEKQFGFLWFFPDPEILDKIEALTGERPSESIEARVTWCNPTPPILPELGGFTDPDTRKYCHIDLPDEWHCAYGHEWMCRGFKEALQLLEDGRLVPYDPVGVPPYYGEWGVVSDGKCTAHGKVGPFETSDEAFGAAVDAAVEHGATALPGDGWAQAKDSRGRGVGPIT